MSAAILIVDNEEEIRVSFEQDPVIESYQVHSAAAGQEALEILGGKRDKKSIAAFQSLLQSCEGFLVMTSFRSGFM